MWRLNPEFLSGDATYNVDNFGMPLFQLNGVTSTHSTFNIYWALLGGESAETFYWVLDTIKQVAMDYKIQLPSVIISDYDMGFQKAAYAVFPTNRLHGQPGTKHQLCLWHVLKNVAHNVKKKWNGSLEGTYLGETGSIKGSGIRGEGIRNTHDRDPEEYRVDGVVDVGAAILATNLLEPADRLQRSANAHKDPHKKLPANYGRAPRDSERSYTNDADGIVCLIRDYIYRRIDDHDSFWEEGKKEFPDQPETLVYWEKYYIPYKEEICVFYTSRNRNFGIKASNRSEGSHAVLKKLLKNRRTDLLQLHTRIVQLTRRIQHAFKDKVGVERRESLSNHLNPNLYKLLFKQIPKIALLKIQEQEVIAKQKLKEKAAFDDDGTAAASTFEVRCAPPSLRKPR